MVLSMRVARRMRRFWLLLCAAQMGGVMLEVLFRRSLELGFAAGAAEEHVLAIVRQPMRRIRFDNHAADWVVQFSALVRVVSVLMMRMACHVVLANVLALLISLAPEPAPSHNGKVNTENSGSIP